MFSFLGDFNVKNIKALIYHYESSNSSGEV